GGPHNHTTAAIAVALKEASTDDFKAYAAQIVTNAKALADELNALGFDLVSGGTDNHLVLIDLTSKGVPGKVAAKALDRAKLETNYNAVPYDTRKPFDPSGLRIGTAAVTSRGMGENEMRQIARWMDAVVRAAASGDEAVVERVAGEVADLTKAFPAPGILL
ncbi:MAG: glycine hydroxymethyltransferase, partial [Frankiales bacterium]|nr:glycine hydroxymethyltransferase [Frankiales bacterium]